MKQKIAKLVYLFHVLICWFRKKPMYENMEQIKYFDLMTEQHK